MTLIIFFSDGDQTISIPDKILLNQVKLGNHEKNFGAL